MLCFAPRRAGIFWAGDFFRFALRFRFSPLSSILLVFAVRPALRLVWNMMPSFQASLGVAANTPPTYAVANIRRAWPEIGAACPSNNRFSRQSEGPALRLQWETRSSSGKGVTLSQLLHAWVSAETAVETCVIKSRWKNV